MSITSAVGRDFSFLLVRDVAFSFHTLMFGLWLLVMDPYFITNDTAAENVGTFLMIVVLQMPKWLCTCFQ